MICGVLGRTAQWADGDVYCRRCHWRAGIWLLPVESYAFMLCISGMAANVLQFYDGEKLRN